jgi:hypothetical protein
MHGLFMCYLFNYSLLIIVIKDLTICGGVIVIFFFSSFVETSFFVISFPFKTSRKSTLKIGISSTRKYLMNDDIYI